MTAFIIVSFMLLLIGLGAPVAFAMGIAGAAGLYYVGGTSMLYGVLSSGPHDTAAAYEFLTIPMFLLMAEFVLRSGIADDLFAAAAAWVGRVPGGLGMATALAGAGFGAICGSSTASAATLSSTSLPAMKKHGYSDDIAAGAVAISGTLAMLIPPSIAMVIYGLLTDTSIAKMLVAGVIPGIIVTGGIMATIYALALLYPHDAPRGDRASWAEKFGSLKRIGPMLVLLGAVTGALYTGIATPTEASALGALMAGILYFWRGRRTRAEVLHVLTRAAMTSCMVGFILIGASIFSTVIALTQTTQSIIGWIGGLPVETWVIMLILVCIYIFLGFFLDQMAILVLTLPIAAPLVQSMGYDLIWFGVIVVVTAELGMVTPPMGLNVFVVSKYAGIPTSVVFKGTIPHVIAHLLIIAVLMIFPSISMWLPNQM